MLSCYTTSLLGHLRGRVPDADERFREAIDLSVRVDLPAGDLAFEQHRPVDPTLRYRGRADWDSARQGLLTELDRAGDVIVVANCRNLPWSPSYRREDTPHWLRLNDHRDGRWSVVDDFDALLPLGHQQPYHGRLSDAELRELLAPLPALPLALHRRDVHALGAPVDVPAPGTYRWLEHGPAGAAAHAEEGRWVRGTGEALAYLARRLVEDPVALRRHTEDLWAAARHHQYRLDDDEEAVAAWGELARSLRFAVQSADRGRPRPTLITRAFDRIEQAHAGRREVAL